MNAKFHSFMMNVKYAMPQKGVISLWYKYKYQVERCRLDFQYSIMIFDIYDFFMIFAIFVRLLWFFICALIRGRPISHVNMKSIGQVYIDFWCLQFFYNFSQIFIRLLWFFTCELIRGRSICCVKMKSIRQV